MANVLSIVRKLTSNVLQTFENEPPTYTKRYTPVSAGSFRHEDIDDSQREHRGKLLLSHARL